MKETTHSYSYVVATIRQRRHLLVHEGCARIALESLVWLRKRAGMELFGFVVLPSRLHFLCRLRTVALPQLLARFESFTTARMTAKLQQGRRNFLVQSFYADSEKDSIWGGVRVQENLDARDGWERLMEMHQLPLASEWRLAETPEAYPLSSACFYAKGVSPVIPVDDFRVNLAEDETIKGLTSR
jgi:hypothetical protein